MKKLSVTTAAAVVAVTVVAALAVFVAFTAPPRHLTLSAPVDGTVAGVLHVHTNRSDGLSGPDEIAAAAARAGLKFVVFTDHGDGTRKPDPPVYRAGVLCMDGVEISTTGGHYVAIDMPAAPYPLGGEARDVVEDVRRLGGFGIAAHPDSPKLELRWREWTAPFDAIEIVNPDTSWRVHAQQKGWRSRLKLIEALVDYPFRPAETIASLLHRPEDIPVRWSNLTERRRVVTLAGADAHAKLALRNVEPTDSAYLPLPGYEPAFRVSSIHVRPERPLTGDAANDAAIVMRGIRAGHLYTAIDGLATPPSFEFTASNEAGSVAEGDELRAGTPVTLHVRTNAPSSFTTTVWKGTKVLSGNHHEPEFSVAASEAPAVYWVDVRATPPSPELAWVTSNAIYVRGPEPLTVPPMRARATQSQSIFDGAAASLASAWRLEHDPTSAGAIDLSPNVGGNELRLRFALSDQISPAPVVALVYDTPGGMAPNNRLTFTIRADRPMRVSVQLRAAGTGSDAQRWHRSVYVGTEPEERTVYFDDLSPIGATETFRPPLDAIRSIMFVIDPVNTKRLTDGRFWIKSAALQR